LKFTLRVTGCDPAITSAAAETTITVLDIPDPNQPPVAAATVSPEVIYTSYAVTLDGSGSSDPDGNSLTYLWEQIDGTEVVLSGANSAMATFTAPFAPYPNGTSLKFKLTVSDGTLQASTEQIVNVLWLNAPPTARVSCPASVDEGDDFTLNGSDSRDPDDGIAAYSWSQTNGGPVAILPLDLATVSITATAPLLGSPLDTMSFKLEVTDAGGLMDDAECNVKVNDITPPEAAPTQSPAANGHGWNNTDVTVTWDWVDLGVGIDEAKCTESSTSSGEGLQLELNATCTDLSGNEGSSSYKVNVDKTGPGVNWTGGINGGDSFYFGSVPAAPTCQATDALSGLADDCAVTGYSALVGSHTLTATAHDKAGNETKVERQYTVQAWTLKGFYQPVDMGGVWNTVKGGSTVPLKFEVFAANELTDIGVVNSFMQQKVQCTGGALEDAIEVVSTGGTSLRYDSTAGQFIQNWQTPKLPGACYMVTMTTDDGSSLVANFKLK
jgi:hypothetical protein